MSTPHFQPFTDRLSRDIRNTLSEAFLQSLQQRDLAVVQQSAEAFLTDTLANCYHDYIRHRLRCYNLVFKQLGEKKDDPIYVALLLWNQHLFFEVHEILEQAWLQRKGEEKLFLQALIRAAGVYIKLETEQTGPAARMAQKALPVLERNADRLNQYTEPDPLFAALHDLSLPAPLLALKNMK